MVQSSKAGKRAGKIKSFAAGIMLGMVFSAAAGGEDSVRPPPGAFDLPDMTAHPLAGTEVEVKVAVEDGIGQQARSRFVTVTLPQRHFVSPIARDIMILRRDLALDSRKATDTAQALDQILENEQENIYNPAIITALANVRDRVGEEGADTTQLDSAVQELWQIMLMLEEDHMTDAERRLRDIEQALSEAMEEGNLSDEEMQELTDEAMEAMEDFLGEKAENAQSDEEKEFYEQMQEMLDEMQEMMEELGDMLPPETVQQMIQDMLQGMQGSPGQPSQGGDMDMMDSMEQMQQQMQDMQQQMEELQELMEILEDLDKVIDGQSDIVDEVAEELERRENELGKEAQQQAMLDNLQNMINEFQNNVDDHEAFLERLGEHLRAQADAEIEAFRDQINDRPDISDYEKGRLISVEEQRINRTVQANERRLQRIDMINRMSDSNLRSRIERLRSGEQETSHRNVLDVLDQLQRQQRTFDRLLDETAEERAQEQQKEILSREQGHAAAYNLSAGYGIAAENFDVAPDGDDADIVQPAPISNADYDSLKNHLEEAARRSRAIGTDQNAVNRDLTDLIRRVRETGMDPGALTDALSQMRTDRLRINRNEPHTADPEAALRHLEQAKEEIQQKIQQMLNPDMMAPSGMLRPGGDVIRDEYEPGQDGVNPVHRTDIDPEAGDNRARVVRDRVREKLTNPDLPDRERRYLERLLDSSGSSAAKDGPQERKTATAPSPAP